MTIDFIGPERKSDQPREARRVEPGCRAKKSGPGAGGTGGGSSRLKIDVISSAPSDPYRGWYWALRRRTVDSGRAH